MATEVVKLFLSQVLSLIEKPESYQSSWFAKTIDNKSVMWDNTNAVKFNLIGAIEKVGADQPEVKEDAYLELDVILERRFHRPRYLLDYLKTAHHLEIIDLLTFLTAS